MAKRGDGGDVDTGGAASGEFAYVRKDSIQDRLLSSNKYNVGGGVVIGADTVLESEEIAWSMPSRFLISYERQVGVQAFLGNMLGTGAADTTAMVGTNNSTHGMAQHRSSSSNSKKGILDANGGLHAGRVAITPWRPLVVPLL